MVGCLLALVPASASRAASSLSFSPVSDAYVSEASPTTNFGSATELSMQSSPTLTGYLLFDPEGLPGTVTSAILRMKANTTSGHGFDLRTVADTTWSEQTLIYANAPPAAGTIFASTGAFSSGQWITVDVTAAVQGNGPVAFALTRVRTTPVSVSSKEAGAVSAPELVVTSSGSLAPADTSPPTIAGSAQEGRTLQARTGAWSGTDPISYQYDWQRCDVQATTCSDTGVAGDTYPVATDDVGSVLRVAVTAANDAGSATATSITTLPVLAAGALPVVAAAGDIACDPADPNFNSGAGTGNACQQAATARLLVGQPVSAVLPLGDEQYECGGSAAWQQSYGPSWGQLKAISRPVPGNHEYMTSGGIDCSSGAAGYFGYFGPIAGEPGKGWYSYDLGAWHLIALNSNCADVGGCGAGSPQEQWLRQDLASSTARCTLAYWHHPLFSSGRHRPGDSEVRPLFQALYDYGADVVLTGHDHNYERFAPQAPSGALDLSRGIRQFIVGTGGAGLYTQMTPLPNSEIRDDRSFGALELTLRPASYDWRFVSVNTGFQDAQSQACDNPPHDTNRPSAPGALAASAASATQVDLGWSPATDNLGVVRYEIYRDSARLATTASAVTGYTDTTASPSTTYHYEVRALDAAGNLSLASDPATVTTPSQNVVAFDPVADARVEAADPNTNFGTSGLRADGGTDPAVQSFLRFDLSGLSGPVQSVKLRLYAYSGTADGPAAYSAGDAWTESGITWANQPAFTSGAVDDKGAIAANSWVEWDVTSLFSGPGIYDFGLATSSTDGVDMYSREAAADRPQLIVTYGSPAAQRISLRSMNRIASRHEMSAKLTRKPTCQTSTHPRNPKTACRTSSTQ